MKITNLSQLKKAIEAGNEFIIITHYKKPHLTGQRRKPGKVQTNGFYSVVPGDPDNEVSRANGGMGYMNWYGSAKQWIFDGHKITQLTKQGEKIMTIQFYES